MFSPWLKELENSSLVAILVKLLVEIGGSDIRINAYACKQLVLTG
jgi:hypothetical protein